MYFRIWPILRRGIWALWCNAVLQLMQISLRGHWCPRVLTDAWAGLALCRRYVLEQLWLCPRYAWVQRRAHPTA